MKFLDNTKKMSPAEAVKDDTSDAEFVGDE